MAYSGGADSTALLVACAARWPGQVTAWHIHHGLQPAADAFAEHCAERCRALGVPLTTVRVDARPVHGQSPEDAARIARYRAFDRLARSDPDRAPTVLLAQHADDQAETLLLALSRGAGLPGMAAMPARWQRRGVHYARPLLEVPAAAIRAWLQVHHLDWIEDPTNADPRFIRNHIRLQVLPALERVFPAFLATFARSARHAAQAQELLDEVAASDLDACGDPPRIDALRQLSPARQGNLLRHWIARCCGRAPSSAQLTELQAQISACVTRGHRIDLKAADGHVRRQGDFLTWSATSRQPPEVT